MSPEAIKEGVPDTSDALFSYLIERVRNNLHIILCMSPVGDPFRYIIIIITLLGLILMHNTLHVHFKLCVCVCVQVQKKILVSLILIMALDYPFPDIYMYNRDFYFYSFNCMELEYST